MIRVDMHLHTRYSKHPSEWFLQKIGARESYTDVERVYQIAKSRGMDFVTVTDHNTIDGALELTAAHPEDTFISCEFTSYFPENGCKVHILAYGITPAQFDVLNDLRTNIYEMREYLRSNNIACSVAHATYSVNGKMDMDTLEKLILLFDVFENINGARSASSNEPWCEALQRLMPGHIEELYQKHGIEPWGADSWIKGFTAGSDDHAGLFAGETWTRGDAAGIDGFLRLVRARETYGEGKHGSHKSLAFSIYKIACDYFKDRSSGERGGFWDTVNSLMLGDGERSFSEWFNVRRFKLKRDPVYKLLADFMDELHECRLSSPGHKDRIEKVYECLSVLSDSFFKMLAESLRKNCRAGDAGQIFKNITAALPVLFSVAPFYTAMQHQNGSRSLTVDLKRRFGGKVDNHRKKILWFSDTVAELNGVAVTMRHLARCAEDNDRTVKIVYSLDEGEQAVPGRTLVLPSVCSFTPEFYNAFTIRIPSILRSLDAIQKEEPDEIVVSTPGPVGMLGYIAARALGVKCTGVYHTDFTKQVSTFIDDEMVTALVEWYTRWFFGRMDELRVPSSKYMEIMEERGLDRSKMKLFPRGIDADFVCTDDNEIAAVKSKYCLDGRFVVLWAGRLGQEKNIDYLLKVFHEFRQLRPDSVLVLAGDGPMQDELTARYRSDAGIVLTGRVDRRQLAVLYAAADVFAFPSVTDTFGMVVLEAQASGLPAIVSDKGGPQDIVKNKQSGFVLGVDDTNEWVNTLVSIHEMKTSYGAEYAGLRVKIRELFECKTGWLMTLDDMLLSSSDSKAEKSLKAAPMQKRQPVQKAVNPSLAGV